MELIWWGIVVLLIACAAFRPIGIDRDSVSYAETINHYVATNFADIEFLRFEPTFFLIILISKWMFHDPVRGVFIIYATIAVIIKALAIRRILGISFFSLFVYICLFYILHELTQIRVGVAIGVFLFALDDIHQRKPVAYFIKALIAMLFHYSALIMLPLFFFNQRKHLFYMLPILGIFFVLLVPNNMFTVFFSKIFHCFPDIVGIKLRRYLLYFTSNYSLLKLFFTSKVYIFFLLFYYFCLLIEKNNLILALDGTGVLLMNIFSFSLFTYFLFIRQRVLALRPAEILFSVLVIIIPLIAQKFTNARYRAIFIAFISIACITILIGDQIVIKKLLKIEFFMH